MDTEEIEYILNCPICMDEYDDPRILPCQHSFCEACLSSYIKDRRDNNRVEVKTFPCPVCRRKTKLRNNVDDASAFERDLTKLALLESKHILLEQEDDSQVESSATCETQTITTDNGEFHVKPIAEMDDIHRNILTTTNRHSKSSKKGNGDRPVANDVSSKAIRTQSIKSKNRIKRQKKLGKRRNLKTELVGENTMKEDNRIALEFTDYLLVTFILVPLYKQPLNNRSKMLARLLAAMLFLIYTACMFTVPYFSVLLSCFVLVCFWRSCRQVMSSYCFGDEENVRFFDMLFFLALQCSLMFLIFIAGLYVFAFSSACKNTLSNALWKNDSVVSVQEFEGNFVASASGWLHSIRILNVNTYHFIKQIINFILFLS